tara:strand:- start:126 stop:569 length:444 start_codon:yes stop_codon:yes gene_type:complete
MKDIVTESPSVITPVPIEYLDAVWPQVEEFIERAVRTTDGKFTTQSVYKDAKRGFYTLWIIVRDDVIMMMFTTRILEYPTRRGLAVDWAGGSNMMKVLDLWVATLREYAINNNCSHLEGYGRKAWGRCLEKYGWEPEYTAYKMEISQ